MKKSSPSKIASGRPLVGIVVGSPNDLSTVVIDGARNAATLAELTAM